MISSKSFVLLSLCMDISSESSDRKPLTNAEFHKLMRALDSYNSAEEENGQQSLFPSENSVNFELLPEMEKDFFTTELGLKEKLGSKIVSLLKHSSIISFEIERLENTVQIVTIFDDKYPKKLAKGLAKMPDSMREPPLLYCCGDPSLQDLRYAGFVGSRSIDETDVNWTQNAVKRISEKHQIDGVISGGAEGTDRTAEVAALELSMAVIEFSKNIRNSLKDALTIDAVQEERMLLLSEINPLRKLSRQEAVAHFMNRNKYIYAMAEYAVVVRSAKGPKSGTWSGAKEALERSFCEVYVRNADYEGNIDLIAAGGKRID